MLAELNLPIKKIFFLIGLFASAANFVGCIERGYYYLLSYTLYAPRPYSLNCQFNYKHLRKNKKMNKMFFPVNKA